MAELIPSLNSCIARMQAGERRFARRLISHLEDDYVCWYDQAVGTRPKYTDFVILHPNRGLLLLEVKDWKLDTIHKINKESVELVTNSGLKTIPNPYAQVRQCAYRLVNQLIRDPQLKQPEGKYRGGLVMPYGFGVVLTSITRAQFEAMDLGQVLPEHLVICKDEMAESVEIEDFQKRLWDMFSDHFKSVLTQPQIDRIRWHMFPEIRVAEQLELGRADPESGDFDIPDLIKVMDLQQEKIARGLGEGHRIIHGVAGSGKTMILAYRCVHLARLLHKPILVLCYNVTLAARLREMVEEHGVRDRVNVYSFHRWCQTILKTYNLSVPDHHEDVFDTMVNTVIENTAKGNIPKGQYGAVLIDEGHDFQAEWLRLVVDMVDPDTNSLLLLYDDAQSIYRRGTGLGFALKDVGISAQGRTTVLRLNYRNSRQILSFAYDFVDDYLDAEARPDDRAEIIAPESGGQSGPPPVVKDFPSFAAEAEYIVGLFRRLHEERGLHWRSMSALYCHNWMGKTLFDLFKKSGIPVQWMKSSAEKREFRVAEDSVKLMTMHSSKGLEFETVAACGVGYMGTDDDRLVQDAKLLYVAMTRATKNLLVTCSRQGKLADKIHLAADQLQGSPMETELKTEEPRGIQNWFGLRRSNQNSR
ncbi:MAG: NERD domain-containing protein/DEAD/DEAH box helicase [Pseudomonadales bacterium]